MLTRAMIAAAAVAGVALLVAGARAVARLAEDLDAFTDAVHDELQAAVDDPATAGTNWTWLTGHPAPPYEPDVERDIEALARSLGSGCTVHWAIGDDGHRIDLPDPACPACARVYDPTGDPA